MAVATAKGRRSDDGAGEVSRAEHPEAEGSNGRGAGSDGGKKGGRKLKDLVPRVISGVVYALLFFACLFGGAVPSAIFMAVLSVLCCYEFFRLMRESGKMPNLYIGLTSAALFAFCALGQSVWLMAALFLLVFAAGLWYLYTPRTRIEDVCVTVFGPIYTGYMLSAIVLIRCAVPGWEGGLLCVGVVGSVMVSDSFAYLVGGRIGRHKLAPKISPHKTWEGFVGGLAGSVLVWILLWAVQLYDLSLGYAIVCGLVVGIFGVFGDLIESRIKRSVGVKDSGNLMPGHGGMLDRCDSLIFAGIVARILLVMGGVI